MADPGYDLALPFDTDDPEFARGFEAGRIWALLFSTERAEDLDGQPFHTTNVEMVLRMLDFTNTEGLTAEFTDDQDWMVLRYDPS